MKKDKYGFSIQDYLLGNASAQMWIAMMILSFMAMYVMMSQRVKKRDILSERTPTKFSLTWFIGDNVSRIISSVFAMILFTRATLVWVEPKYTVVFSIVVGIISDQIPVIFGFVKETAIIKIKTVVTSWFGSGEKKVTKTETTIEVPKSEIKP